MSIYIALIDANNFYASCEELIDPSLEGKPVVVLSNNDGCIISRNSRARKLNIKMGQPYFKISQKLKHLGVKVFSSNYPLYGDMSQRLMSLLKNYCDELEIYSIDEAFVKLNYLDQNKLTKWSYQLRALIYKNLGLPIAIGIGSNKVQAKIANHLAKSLEKHAGIFNLTTEENQDKYLNSVKVEDVWGIGRQIGHCCRAKGIKTALQLRDMPSNDLKKIYGVTGIKIQKELRGESCIHFSSEPTIKKETCVSRSFCVPLTKKEELRQAIAIYVVRASAKLRKQNQITGKITLFARNNIYKKNFYSNSVTKKLEVSTNDTNILLKVSLSLVEKIYRSDCPLTKVGVIMQNLQNQNSVQLNLHRQITSKNQRKKEKLIQTIDNLNKRYGDNTVTWCICDNKNKIPIRQERLSLAATTRYTEILIANS
tara:strand:- start:35634 stop:36908 length:1275 start_codon:yes stop_codon:yes gene_type:complete